MDENSAKKALESQRRKRRMLLLKLINDILSGNFNAEQPSKDDLYSLHTSVRDQYLHGPRPHYISPEDRSTYNSGYMQMDEMTAGDPNIW